jgi:Wiskott-Aldrich syndrome protein
VIFYKHFQGLRVIKSSATPKKSSTPSTPKKFFKKSSKAQSKENVDSMELSFVGADQLILMVEIHKKIMAFRDIMDLAPCNSSASLREVCD